MTRILLCRHGRTEWNKALRLQGHTDNELDEYGLRQAKATGSFVRAQRPRRSYVSPLKRTRQTYAQYGLDVDPVLFPAIQEQQLGAWDGVCELDLPPEELSAWRAGGFTPDGAEPYEALRDRLAAGFFQVVRESADVESSPSPDLSHAVRTVVLVSHGAALRVMMEHLGLIDRQHFVPLTPASVSVVDVTIPGFTFEDVSAEARARTRVMSDDEIRENVRLRVINLSPEMIDPDIARFA